MNRCSEVWKAIGVAEMADHFAAVDVGLEESELHPVERRQQRHRVDRRAGCCASSAAVCRREDAVAVVLAVLQVRDHELRHVGAGRRQRAGRRGPTISKPLALPGRAVAGRHLRRAPAGSGWRKVALRHAERREDVLLDVVVERLARDALRRCSRPAPSPSSNRPASCRARRCASGIQRFSSAPSEHRDARVVDDQVLDALPRSRRCAS